MAEPLSSSVARGAADGERIPITISGRAAAALVSPADAALAEAVQAFATARGLEWPPAPPQRRRRDRRAEAEHCAEIFPDLRELDTSDMASLDDVMALDYLLQAGVDVTQGRARRLRCRCLPECQLRTAGRYFE